ncbi:hypothetical protein HELRODRAFT_182980 [Helobdella robusta]|uniref:Uncharacterized protein n=1 Tax=Helobdella robusta TaxID=6412 RepID=T1FJ15_HELRO|nr:hypothetical protein HELRODRAFT_182980 [Helobdella robusta]ESN89971.1 hypothetical protein HELRODRAFT_182980 [Helobdella robusta]
MVIVDFSLRGRAKGVVRKKKEKEKEIERKRVQQNNKNNNNNNNNNNNDKNNKRNLVDGELETDDGQLLAGVPHKYVHPWSPESNSENNLLYGFDTFEISIDGGVIKRAETIQFLRVFIKSDLPWINHIFLLFFKNQNLTDE